MKPSSPLLPWQSLLAQRGYLESALDMGWKPDGNGWVYPLFNPVGEVASRRWKNFDSKGDPKNLWKKDSSPKLAPFYHHPEVVEHIRRAGGHVYLVAGEPDTLTLYQVGRYNTISPSSGEKLAIHQYAAFREYIISLEATEVVQIVDNDGTGLTYAAHVGAALAGTDIRHEAHVLRVKDANDLWKLHKFNRDSFLQELDQAPLAELPVLTSNVIQFPDKPPKKEGTYTGEDNFERVKDRADIVTLVGKYVSLKQKGSRWAACCPFHSEKSASFIVDEDAGTIRCYGQCQETWDIFSFIQRFLGVDKFEALKIAAQHAGVELVFSRNEEVEADLSAAPAEQPGQQEQPRREPVLYHWQNGIPDLFRQNIMRLNMEYEDYEDQTPGLIIAEVINEAVIEGRLNPVTDPVTVQSVIDYTASSGRSINETTARRGLDQWRGLGFLRRQDVAVGKGRPVAYYWIKPLADGLIAFKEMLCHHTRKSHFIIEGIDLVPDTVTAQWLMQLNDELTADLTPDQAEYAAQLINADRESMYQDFADARQKAEAAYQRETQRISTYTLQKLQAGLSINLDPADTWSNAAEYRMSYYKARSAFRHQKHIITTQDKAAEELGITARTLYALRQKAGIVLDEQFTEIAVASGHDVIAKLPRWAAKREYGNYLVAKNTTGEQKVIPFQSPKQAEKTAIAYRQQGYSVTLRLLSGSLERLATDEEKIEISAKLEEQRKKRRQVNQLERLEREADERETAQRLQLAKVEHLLKESFDVDRRWIREQLDFKPGWELIIEAVKLGASITPETDLIAKFPTISDTVSIYSEKSQINTSIEDLTQPTLFGDVPRDHGDALRL